MSDIAAELNDLFDLLATHRNGLYRREIEKELGWTQDKVCDRVRRLRRVFANEKENVVCRPGPTPSRDWIYRLTGDYDQARFWLNNRMGDMESRLETVHAVANSIKLATPAASVDGRKSRLVVKVLGRLIEDLADVTA